MIYRAAERADMAVVQAMLADLARHEGGSGAVAPVAVLEDHGFGPRPLFRAVLACAEEPCGMAIYYPDFSTHRGQPGVYVQDLFVERRARGGGVGRGLLAAVMRLQDWGACYLTLGVGPDNAAGLAFYARLGFRTRGYRFMILDGERLEAL